MAGNSRFSHHSYNFPLGVQDAEMKNSKRITGHNSQQFRNGKVSVIKILQNFIFGSIYYLSSVISKSNLAKSFVPPSCRISWSFFHIFPGTRSFQYFFHHSRPCSAKTSWETNSAALFSWINRALSS